MRNQDNESKPGETKPIKDLKFANWSPIFGPVQKVPDQEPVLIWPYLCQFETPLAILVRMTIKFLVLCS